MIQAIESEQREMLSQVWIQLAREHQAGVIQRMAELMLKLILEQMEDGGTEGEDASITGA
jgi:hypothetical protein